MRSFISVVAIFAALALGAASTSALGTGSGPANAPGAAAAGHVDTQLNVNSSSKDGVTFTAPETAHYHFTIVSGAYCYLTLKAGETSPYGGWLTQILIYTKAVAWGAPDQWGKHPIDPDATVGDFKREPTSAEAEAAGKGAAVTVNLQKGARVTLLVSDGSNYYADNKGVMKVRITADVASSALTAPPVPTKSVPNQNGTAAGGTTLLLKPQTP